MEQKKEVTRVGKMPPRMNVTTKDGLPYSNTKYGALRIPVDPVLKDGAGRNGKASTANNKK